MEPNLSNGAGAAPENNPNIPTSTEFSEVVKESAEKVQQAAAPPPKSSGPKRGRGRPRNASPETAQSAPPPTPPVPPPDMVKHLKVPIKLFGSIPARKTGIPELALDDQEAQLAAEAIQGIFDAWIPDLSKMSPKAASLVTAGLVFGSLATTKYMIYLDRHRPVEKSVENPGMKIPEVEVMERNDGSAPPLNENSVLASERFKKK